jgi:cytochrome P450
VNSTAPIELSEEFLREPGPLYEQLRAQGPIHHVRLPAGLRGWLITDYTVAKQVLADPTIRKDVHQIRRIIDTTHPGVHAMGSDMAEHMLNTDPPDHTRLRRLVAKAFTPRSVAALVPRIEQIADELIAAIPTHTGPVDLLSAFAFPLPITVICELLGIPATDRDQFRAWTNTIMFAGTDSRETVLTAAANMNAYLRDLITDRRAHPGDDMLSGLASATDTDGNLTDTEVVSMTFLLLVAGHETTVNLIGNTMLTLLQDPERFAGLRAHPDQIPAALEEHLRHLGPVHIATLRFTTEPVTLGDTTIGPDELVFVSLAAANRDPSRFARPELVDYDRDNPGHLAFGHGIHVCLGAPLARAEGTIALTRLLAHYPHVTLATDPATLAWRTSSLIRGLDALPVQLR